MDCYYFYFAQALRLVKSVDRYDIFISLRSDLEEFHQLVTIVLAAEIVLLEN